MKRPEPPFRLSLVSWLLLGRSAPGLAAIALAAQGSLAGAGLCLVLASLLDLVVDSVAGRLGWPRTATDVQIEGFVDFLTFVWAPSSLVLALSDAWTTILAASVFALGGIVRLSRFNVVGMTDGGYVGLPVTYSGVVVPVLALAASQLDEVSATRCLGGGLVVFAALMVSSRFVTPRVSL